MRSSSIPDPTLESADGSVKFSFLKETNHYNHHSKLEATENVFSYVPAPTNSILTQDIEVLNQINNLRCYFGVNLNFKNHDKSKRGKLQVTIEVNGKRYQSQWIMEPAPDKFETHEMTIDLTSFYKDILKDHKKSIGL